MKTVRQMALHRCVMPILALLLTLRSLVAPGLSLESSKDSSGLALNYCTNLIVNATKDPEGHTGHTHIDPGHVYDLAVPDMDYNPPSSGTDHEHDMGHGLSNSHCGLWTASGTYVAANLYDPANQFSWTGRETLPYPQDSVAITSAYYLRQSPRAPPSQTLF